MTDTITQRRQSSKPKHSQVAQVQHSRLTKPNMGGSDKYLTFAFVETDHGTECEMVGWTILNLFAQSTKRECIKGVVHLEGQIIFIFDPKAIHGRGATIMTNDVCIVIFNYSEPSKRPFGIVVEGIANVINIAGIKTCNQKPVERINMGLKYT